MGAPGSSDLNLFFSVTSIIGLSDGLTVPFALTAGLSSLGRSDLVYMGGLAEIVSVHTHRPHMTHESRR